MAFSALREFGSRMDNAGGWSIWNPSRIPDGLWFDDFPSAEKFFDACKILEETLANSSEVDFCDHNVGQPLKAPTDRAILYNIYSSKNDNESALCLIADNAQDMDKAVRLFETDLRPVLRTIMREAVLDTHFRQAVIPYGPSDVSSRLFRAFQESGDMAGEFACEGKSDIPDSPARQARSRLVKATSGASFNSIAKMMADRQCPEIFKNVARIIIPVLNDPGPGL